MERKCPACGAREGFRHTLDCRVATGTFETYLTMTTQDGTVIVVNKEAPMPRDKIKPPAESKADLMKEVGDKLDWKFANPQARIEFLLNFFTSADLVGIRDELRK